MKAQWTALVAAAGRGTRLDFDRPKILFPVGGRTILERLTSLFSPVCAELVFVLSPEGAPVVEPHLPGGSRVAIQHQPTGMGDAVSCGAALVESEYVVIAWGDQVALRRESIEAGMHLLETHPEAEAVCPTLIRAQPYIHFERDARGGISRVLQQREGDAMPSQGESDSGLFFFRTAALRAHLAELPLAPDAFGARTREFNLLPIFPLIARRAGALLTPCIMTEIESVGVNTVEDAALLEAHSAL